MSRPEDYWRRYWQRRRQAEKGQQQFPGILRMWDIPTRFGCMVWIILVIMFIWSANYQLNLGYALTFLLFVLWLFGWVMVAQELAGLRVSVHPGKPVWAGEQATFFIHIQEENGRNRAEVCLRNDWEKTAGHFIEAQSTTVLLLHEPAQRRGRHQMSMFEIFSTYPAGAFVAWQWVWLQAEILVYPQPKGDLPLPWQGVAGQGKLSAAAPGDDEFWGLRPYVLGDALSRVAWKRYGRGELLLKQFSGEGTQRILLDYAALTGDTEKRLSQLAQ